MQNLTGQVFDARPVTHIMVTLVSQQGMSKQALLTLTLHLLTHGDAYAGPFSTSTACRSG